MILIRQPLRQISALFFRATDGILQFHRDLRMERKFAFL